MGHTLEGRLPLPDELTLAIEGGSHVRLERALARFQLRVAQLTDRTLDITPGRVEQPALIRLAIGEFPGYPSLDTDESYHLRINGQGVELSASTIYGAVWGLQTLLQLVASEDGQLFVPYVDIQDQPRFAWRGMLLDVVRHWMPVETVERLLDSMEAVKLNVLHLHLSDDQGFRMASDAFPELQNKASGGDFYSRKDMLHLLSYAADRGIRIVPEFGLPGHSGSWQQAYPMLSVPDADGSGGGLHSVMFSNPIDPTREEVYEFIDLFVAEMAALFPDRFWHIGGDEVNATAWEGSPSIQAFMSDNALLDHGALQAYFSQRYNTIVQRHGKVAIGWDEVLHPELPASTIVHAWRADAELDFGEHQVLVSSNYYLDQQHPVEMMYRFDPLDVLQHSGEVDDSAVLGAEIANWSETIDGDTVDLRTWPRAAALAELYWSPRGLTANMTSESLYTRVEHMGDRLARTGSIHRSYSEKKISELAGSGDAEALLVLASVTEPTPFSMMQYMKSWPFVKETVSAWWEGDEALEDHAGVFFRVDEFADFLPGESETARVFRADVSRWLADTSNDELKATLLERLRLWRDNHGRLTGTIADSELLRNHDVESVSLGLRELADTGQASIDAIERREPMPEPEHTALSKNVSSYEFDYAGLPVFSKPWLMDLRPLGLRQHRLAIQPAIEELLEAAKQ